ncbi:hypothetical protein ACF0H5_010572 [Mactra antiquata]
MALFGLKLFLCTLCIVCMINLVDCKQVKKLEKDLKALKEKLSALENTLDQKIDKLQNQMEEKLSAFNSNINEDIEDKIQLECKECTAGTTELRKLLEGPYFKCLTKGRDAFEDSCYVSYSSKVAWRDAVNACSEMGARLAEVNSKGENYFLSKLRDVYKLEHTWLGGSDLVREGVWTWQASKQEFSFTSWNTGEPNNANSEHCVHLSSSGVGWNDITCSRLFSYICEYTA